MLSDCSLIVSESECSDFSLIDIWPKKMKIGCSRQTCAGGRTDIVTWHLELLSEPKNDQCPARMSQDKRFFSFLSHKKAKSQFILYVTFKFSSRYLNVHVSIFRGHKINETISCPVLVKLWQFMSLLPASLTVLLSGHYYVTEDQRGGVSSDNRRQARGIKC